MVSFNLLRSGTKKCISQSSSCGLVGRPSIVSVRMQVWSLALLSGLRISVATSLWHRLQMRVRSSVATLWCRLWLQLWFEPKPGNFSVDVRRGKKEKKRSLDFSTLKLFKNEINAISLDDQLISQCFKFPG